MILAVLSSGGKDSIYSIYTAESMGWEVKYIVSVYPKTKESYMFHFPLIELAQKQAESMHKKFIKVETNAVKEEEMLDLKKVLEKLDIDGVISGAVASEYQKQRIDFMCEELGIKSFAPLWHKNPLSLLKEQAETMEIIISGVAAGGLDESWLGKKIDEKTIEELIELEKKYGIQTGGEGGEFETLVVNSPLFEKPLQLPEFKKQWDGTSGYLELKQ